MLHLLYLKPFDVVVYVNPTAIEQSLDLELSSSTPPAWHHLGNMEAPGTKGMMGLSRQVGRLLESRRLQGSTLDGGHREGVLPVPTGVAPLPGVVFHLHLAAQ